MKKFFVRVTMCLPLLAILFAVRAQSLDDVKTQLSKDWERAKVYTVDYLNTMPPGDYGFRATDSIRSFAQQMLHLANVNCFLVSSATDQQPPSFIMSDLEHSATAQSKDSVMYYVTASYDYCINGVKNLDVSRWFESKKLFSFDESRFAIMNKAFEHQTHHRGQCTIYVRLKGIKPPEERLF